MYRVLTITATQARNKIGELWEAVAREPVTVTSNGVPTAVVLSPEDYSRLTLPRKPRMPGSMKYLLQNVDTDALLATPIDDVFADYM
jgi:prevent-host-death family protein